MATTLEGEVAYISSMVVAKLGHLTVWGVALSGFLGGMTRDSAIFFSARYASRSFLSRRPKLMAKINRAGEFLSRRPWWILIFHRYMYGFSTATLVVLASSAMTNWQFILLCIAACITWIVGFGLLGYFAAQQVLSNLDWLGAHFIWILLSILLIVLIVWFYKSQKSKRYPFQ